MGRVDLLAKDHNSGHVPVDSKVPLAAYWDGLELDDGGSSSPKNEEHANDVKKHVNDLASRDYALLQGTDFTVMFIPAEPILSTAFEYEPSLQEYAFQQTRSHRHTGYASRASTDGWLLASTIYG